MGYVSSRRFSTKIRFTQECHSSTRFTGKPSTSLKKQKCPTTRPVQVLTSTTTSKIKAVITATANIVTQSTAQSATVNASPISGTHQVQVHTPPKTAIWPMDTILCQDFRVKEVGFLRKLPDLQEINGTRAVQDLLIIRCQQSLAELLPIFIIIFDLYKHQTPYISLSTCKSLPKIAQSSQLVALKSGSQSISQLFEQIVELQQSLCVVALSRKP